MQPNEFLEKLSTHVRNAIATGISVATSLHHETVGPIHLLYGLLAEKGSIAADILQKHEVQKKQLYTFLSQLPHTKPDKGTRGMTTTTTLPELNADAKRALEKAILAAYERSHTYVGTEHLLHGVVALQDETIISFFDTLSVPHDTLSDHIATSLESTSKLPDIQNIADVMSELQQIADGEPIPDAKQSKKKGKKRKQATALDIFTRDLTDKYELEKIDPVIGREEEIERIIHILSRRTKNNPVLVGEPGVGKTAIVEGLAKRIAAGDVPEVLRGKKILSLDLTLMIAGTIYRGEFEARLKQIIDDVEHNPNVMLFIDELHTIIGAGSNQGAMDAANILKPALARGVLRCIGATTHDEYKKYIAGDPALERRFQAVYVEEPSADEAKDILHGLKELYDTFHHTNITHEAIDAAVELSTKYIHDTFLPDKAIDLIDEAAAKVKVARKASPLQTRYHKLMDEYNTYQDEKELAITEERFDDATKWKEKVQAVEKKLGTLQKKMDDSKKPQRKKVTAADIATVLGKRLRIAPETLLQSDWQRLKDVSTTLRDRIVGQDHVIDQLIRSLRQSYIAEHTPNKPLASLLFVGPSGVGKTSLAKALAKELYHSDKALIRLDMSEFSEGHGVSKLLGSPAGYVGHHGRNHFAEAITKRPYAVVLFDEIDKAHPDVQKLLLQILDDGMLTDSHGKKIRFNRSIVVLTTNVGHQLFKSHGIGFGIEGKVDVAARQQERNTAISQLLKRELGTALMSRLHTTCIFSPLEEAHIEQIITKKLDALSAHIADTQQIHIETDKAVVPALRQEHFDLDTGARHVETAVQTLVNDLLVDILEQTHRKKKQYILKKKTDSYHLV